MSTETVMVRCTGGCERYWTADAALTDATLAAGHGAGGDYDAIRCACPVDGESEPEFEVVAAQPGDRFTFHSAQAGSLVTLTRDVDGAWRDEAGLWKPAGDQEVAQHLIHGDGVWSR